MRRFWGPGRIRAGRTGRTRRLNARHSRGTRGPAGAAGAAGGGERGSGRRRWIAGRRWRRRGIWRRRRRSAVAEAAAGRTGALATGTAMPRSSGTGGPTTTALPVRIFYRIGNSALDARPFSVNGLFEPKAAYAQNYFGFSAGGPLFIPKLFNLSRRCSGLSTTTAPGCATGWIRRTRFPRAERVGQLFAGVPGVQLFAPQSAERSVSPAT